MAKDEDVEKWLDLDKGSKPARPAPVAQPPVEISRPVQSNSNNLLLRELQELNTHAAKIRNWVGWIAIWVVAIPALIIGFGLVVWIPGASNR